MCICAFSILFLGVVEEVLDKCSRRERLVKPPPSPSTGFRLHRTASVLNISWIAVPCSNSRHERRWDILVCLVEFQRCKRLNLLHLTEKLMDCRIKSVSRVAEGQLTSRRLVSCDRCWERLWQLADHLAEEYPTVGGTFAFSCVSNHRSIISMTSSLTFNSARSLSASC